MVFEREKKRLEDHKRSKNDKKIIQEYNDFKKKVSSINLESVVNDRKSRMARMSEYCKGGSSIGSFSYRSALGPPNSLRFRLNRGITNNDLKLNHSVEDSDHHLNNDNLQDPNLLH